MTTFPAPGITLAPTGATLVLTGAAPLAIVFPPAITPVVFLGIPVVPKLSVRIYEDGNNDLKP